MKKYVLPARGTGYRGTTEGKLAMTDPEGTPQETELDPESSTGEVTEVTAGVNPEAEKKGSEEAKKKGLTADYQIEGERWGAADYQSRLEKFDNVETPVPVVTLPVKTPSIEKSDEV
jgi:hypothetical protein